MTMKETDSNQKVVSEENQFLTVQKLIKIIKRQLIEWLYLAQERELENLVGVQL